jgi:heat shock protein HtpX
MAVNSDYVSHGVDWREQIRKNNRRSRMVIITFIAIYTCLGLLLDTFITSESYGLPAGTAFSAVIQGYVFPFATVSMAGVAIVALLITYSMYDRIMLMGTEYREITKETASGAEEIQLYNLVQELTIAAGMRYMPKVYVIEADYMNAFASGYSEKSAMVAITVGLMRKLNRAETQAVMAHEISHIQHGDIKLTLTVGVLANIMLMVIDILFYNTIYRRRHNSEGNRFFLIVIILRYVLPIITTLLTLYLSRTREFMADAGAVKLMRDNSPMASALMKIHNDHQDNAEHYREEYGDTAHEDVRRAAYLYDPVKAGIEPVHDFSSFFSTHPTLEQRLAAIGFRKRK